MISPLPARVGSKVRMVVRPIRVQSMATADTRDPNHPVVLPADHDEVLAVVAWAGQHRVAVVPFGGGTSVVGGLEMPAGQADLRLPATRDQHQRESGEGGEQNRRPA